ncbi:MAG: translation initiation factor IF-2 [Thermoguttaceae bacterium]
MPIRIYTLAKELKIDNKKLVDLCTRAGITGKGSALASLTDEEAVRLKAFMAGGRPGKPEVGGGAVRRPGAAGPGTLPGIRREDYIAPGGAAAAGKIPVLPSKPDKPPLTRKKPAEPAAAAGQLAPPPAVAAPVELPPVEPVAVPAPVSEAALPPPAELAGLAELEPPAVEEVVGPAAQSPAAESPAAESPVAAGPVSPPAPTRPLPPPPMSRPLERLLGKLAGRTEKKPGHKPAEKPGPAMHLAPMPAAPSTPRPKAKEPTPQKPDIKLPRDAIRASKAGTKPLSEHIRKHEERKKRDDLAARRGPPRKGEGLAPPVLPPDLSGGKERPRRAAPVARPPAAAEEGEGAGVSTMGGREQRQLKRKRAATAKRRVGGEEEESPATAATGPATVRRTHIRRTGANTAAPRKGKVVVNLPCTVRTFSEAVGVPARTILGKLLALGVVSNIAAALEADTAELLASELGIDADFHREMALEQRMLEAQEQEDDPAALRPRPPIVTFLGHVDHGKTSLLDCIIGIDVAAHEKGGITQYIRAYQVEKDGRSITFVDTPGHEAFTQMRARGANVTDIAVLVVAADDGIMPQTEEAISHARAAGVPIVVALNKMDLPGVNVDRIYQQLAVNDLLPSQWGGETEVVHTSAVTRLGIDQLLETLLTVAELREYKANPDRPARGTCLESEIHEDRGVVAKLLVQSGTLRAGDVLVCGPAYGRVKAMYDTLATRRRHAEAGPSTPVNVTGLSVAPGAGDRFHVLEGIAQARQLARRRAEATRQKELSGGPGHVTLENLFERLGQRDDVQTLNIILRADVRGSIEAIRKEMEKLEHPEVQIRILQATVGGVTEADVHLADASDAVIIGFNVVADEGARGLAEARGVQIRRYDIIYQVTEDLKAALEGMLRPARQERDLGRALVQQVFHISRVGSVAGCRVLAGVLQRDARVRVIRDSQVLGDYAMESLRREKDDAREVREGLECGVHLSGFNDIKEGDVLEAYKIEEIKRTLAGTASA